MTAPADDLVRWWRDSADFARKHGYKDDAKKADMTADMIERLQAEVARLTMSDESVPREREYWIGQLLSGTPVVAASRAIDLLMSQSRKIAALHNARNGRAEAAEARVAALEVAVNAAMLLRNGFVAACNAQERTYDADLEAIRAFDEARAAAVRKLAAELD